MKVLGVLVLAGVCLSMEAVYAQQQGNSGASPVQGSPVLNPIALGDPKPAPAGGVGAEKVVLKNRVVLSGPLAQPLKGGGVLSLPRKGWNLINPFAPVEKPPEPAMRGMEPRAWTTVAGWNPGGSAFPDPITHESSMGLISVSRAK